MYILGLLSSRIYYIDVASNPRKPKIHHITEPNEVYNHGVSIPHTTHCLGNGDIMISCMGDGPDWNGKGDFVLIDGKTLQGCKTFRYNARHVRLKWRILSRTSSEQSGKNEIFGFFLLGFKYTLRKCFESKNFLSKSCPELSNQVLSFSEGQIY